MSGGLIWGPVVDVYEPADMAQAIVEGVTFVAWRCPVRYVVDAGEPGALLRTVGDLEVVAEEQFRPRVFLRRGTDFKDSVYAATGALAVLHDMSPAGLRLRNSSSWGRGWMSRIFVPVDVAGEELDVEAMASLPAPVHELSARSLGSLAGHELAAGHSATAGWHPMMLGAATR